MEEKATKGFRPIITDFEHIEQVLEENHIYYDGIIKKENIEYCKVESQQDCMVGNFCIPKLSDMDNGKFCLAFFITKDKVVIADDDNFANKIIERSTKINPKQYETKEKFLFYFITEFMNRDSALLSQVEKKLVELENDMLNGTAQNFNERIYLFRRKMLILRCYYDEMMDVGIALEENENGYFRNGQLKYFGIISDRADRLMNRATHLLELGREVKATYESKIDARNNANMQFLTVMSAIFLPLTLITGWYGMNFENMPELAHGYPFVIGVSALVVLTVITIFKIKKIL